MKSRLCVPCALTSPWMLFVSSYGERRGDRVGYAQKRPEGRAARRGQRAGSCEAPAEAV